MADANRKLCTWAVLMFSTWLLDGLRQSETIPVYFNAFAIALCYIVTVLLLIFFSRKFDHVTPLLRELHWLSFPERINYKLALLALLVFKYLNGLAPPYLACEFRRVADTESPQRLRSASPAELIIPRVRRETIGGRAFPGRGCKSVEQSTNKCDIIVTFESFQVSLEN